MSDITILHVSDFHWSCSNAKNMEIVVGALCEDLRRLRKDDQVVPDIAIFSGDLVQAGEEPATFAAAYDALLAPMLAAAGLTAERLFIVAGNHDIARSVVRENEILEQGLRSALIGNDAVNAFIDASEDKEINRLALARLAHFENFIRSIDDKATRTSSPLLRTYVVDVSGIKIGIACFNTAWRATGEANNIDRHLLLLGERNVDIAIAALGGVDLRLAVFHHPMDWLAEFDEVAVASRLYSAFDLLFCGHTHRSFPETRTTPIGSSILSQAGCLYQSRDYFNGYQLLRIDPLAGSAEFVIRTYTDNPRRVFHKALNVADEGRASLPFVSRSSTPRLNRVESILREARPAIRQAAVEQINLSESAPGTRLDVKEVFVCPPLRPRRFRSVPAVPEDLPDEEEIGVETLLRESSNVFISGPRESGKSSLAHYMAVLFSEGICDRPRVPVIIDYRQLKRNTYGLRRAISSYLGDAVRRLDFDVGLHDGDFLFLVDNFVVRSTSEHGDFETLIKAQSSCRWICFADAGFNSEAENRELEYPTGFRVAHIQQLPRKSIRELSRRWCVQIGSDSDKIFSTVMNQLRQDNLPRTGYIVTLLLWAVYQERRFERVNEAVLLTNMVDYLLGKADFQQALRREFDPTSKEITLQSLARTLHDRGGVATVNEITEYLLAFFRQKGLTYSAPDVLNKLIECGVLYRSEDDISFKYRCFQEYFLACLFRDDDQERAKVLDGIEFVNYARELDLLSGLRRRNSDLLSVVGDAVERQVPDDIGRHSLEHFDEIAQAESTLGLSRKKLHDMKKKKITADQIDDLMDAADKRLENKAKSKRETNATSESTNNDNKKRNQIVANVEKMSIGVFFTALDLLGRIVRNSEFTDACEKESAARLYLRSCAKSILLINEVIGELLDATQISSKKGTKKLSAEEVAVVRYIANKAIFIGLQEKFLVEFGTEKMFSIYESILKDSNTTSVEKLMLSMLMLDLRHPQWTGYWESLVEDNSKRRFVLDLLTDKIWQLIHTRPLPDQERDRLANLTVRIEEAFGRSKAQKSTIIAGVRKVAAETTRREG